MKIIIVFGPQAVGKMTIGKELEKITDLKLFHNHMTIEMVLPFFSYGTDEGRRLVNLFRKEIFNAVSRSDMPGIIFTYIWNFDVESDWEEIKNIKSIFEKQNGQVCFVELEADIKERLLRNKSELRLKEKPTKRNIDWSENDLLTSFKEKRLNSREGEIEYENYMRLNNTDMSPEEVALKIKSKFKL